MTDITIQSTNISETPKGTLVDVSIADSDDLEQTTEIIHCSVLVKCEGWWGLAAIQKAALHRIRDVIAGEIQRTGHIENQRPG